LIPSKLGLEKLLKTRPHRLESVATLMELSSSTTQKQPMLILLFTALEVMKARSCGLPVVLYKGNDLQVNRRPGTQKSSRFNLPWKG